MAVTPNAGNLVVVSNFLGWIDEQQDQIDALTTDNPRCRVTKSGSQTLTHATASALTFDHEDWDVGPCHSGSSSQLIAPIDGIYEGIAYCVFATDTRGIRTLTVRINGASDVTAARVEPEGTAPTTMTIPWEIYLPEGSYVQSLAYFDDASGGLTSLAVIGASLSMRWVGSPT